VTENKQIEIYQSEDGQMQIQVRLEKDTVWLSQAQMAELFDKNSDTIGLHLRNIYKPGELEQSATTEESSVVRQEGKRLVRQNAVELQHAMALIQKAAQSPSMETSGAEHICL